MTKEIILLGEKFAACKKAHEAAKKALDDIGADWDAVEKELIEAMLEAGVKTIKIDGLGAFTLRRSSYPSVNAGNKPTFFEYLRGAGHEHLLKLDVPTNTLNAFLKRHVEELREQLPQRGLTEFEAECLARMPGYEDAKKKVGIPIDSMDAEQFANDILKSMGASPFTKQDIAFSK